MTKDPNPPSLNFGFNPGDNKPKMMNMGGPPTMSMGGPPMMFMGLGGPMGGPKPVYLPEPMNVNKDPQFIEKKSAQYKACMETINASITDAFNDKVYGMFLGAFVGDSAGAYLEFYGGEDDNDMIKPPESDLDKAMKMPGGGYHAIASGQITDDSEMMQCLLWAYVESNEKVAEGEPKQLDLNLLANRYGDWFNSDPFDIGIATTESI